MCFFLSWIQRMCRLCLPWFFQWTSPHSPSTRPSWDASSHTHPWWRDSSLVIMPWWFFKPWIKRKLWIRKNTRLIDWLIGIISLVAPLGPEMQRTPCLPSISLQTFSKEGRPLQQNMGLHKNQESRFECMKDLVSHPCGSKTNAHKNDSLSQYLSPYLH